MNCLFNYNMILLLILPLSFPFLLLLLLSCFNCCSCLFGLLLLRLNLNFKFVQHLLKPICVVDLSELLEVLHRLDLIAKNCICYVFILKHIVKEKAADEVECKISCNSQSVIAHRTHMQFDEVKTHVDKFLKTIRLFGCHDLLDELS